MEPQRLEEVLKNIKTEFDAEYGRLFCSLKPDQKEKVMEFVRKSVEKAIISISDKK